jgi:hypothetical protein
MLKINESRKVKIITADFFLAALPRTGATENKFWKNLPRF